MKKFFLKSLGCKTNQLEGQLIAQNLMENDFLRVQKIAEADFYILNSCTVTKSADSQVNYLLNKAKRENPSVRTVLAGCVVQAGTGGAADILLDNKQKLEIADILKGENASRGASFALLKKPTSTRVSVKIQEGCNCACSYCIIPKARGASVSNSEENIIAQIEQIAALGHKEIVLTGIHIGQWEGASRCDSGGRGERSVINTTMATCDKVAQEQRGAEHGKSLLDLLREIEKTKIHRYRLGSLYINEIDDEMIEFLRGSAKFCPHFHLSLQSMCDKTLQAMNRSYSAAEALGLIKKLHKNFDLPFLGSDIITGFPGESEEDFRETFKNLAAARLSKIHVFPYSRRPNTLADKMPNQIPENVKKVRARELINLSDTLHKKFLEANLGRELEVIYEKKNPKTGLTKGVSRNYIEIYKPGDKNLKGAVENIILRKKFLLV